MKPDAIQVAVDILRTLGLEDVARWVEHPDAVRVLLCSEPVHAREQVDELCASCGVQLWDFGPVGFATHERVCDVAAAWRALGDPRGAADIERAHEEALVEQGRIERGRSPGEPIDFNLNDPREQRWVALSRTTDGRIAQAAQLVADGLITQDQVRQILDYPLAVGGIVVTR